MPISIIVYTNGKLAAPVEYENAIWKLRDRPNAYDNEKTDLFVECNPIDETQDWEFDVMLEFERRTVRRVLRKWDNKVLIASTIMHIEDIQFPRMFDTKLTIDVKIKDFFITNLGDEFLSVNPNISDAKLLVGDKEVYVCKKVLAQSSTYFYDLFYQTHVDQDVFIIDDVTAEDFLKFLAFLYNRKMSVSHELHGTLAKLSHRFEAEQCIKRCEKILIQFHTMNVQEKLKRAQGFDFDILHDHVLKKLNTTKEILDLGKSPNGSNFGKETKVKLYERMSEIHSQKPYYEQVVSLSDDKREHLVQLGAIPCKITRNGKKVTIQCNWHGITSPWKCEILVSPSSTSTEEAMQYDCDKLYYRPIERLCFDWLNPIQDYSADTDDIRLTVFYFVGMFSEDSIDFSVPRENLTDVVLAVGEKKFNVSKQILAKTSSYFYSMFFSKFDESSKPEIQLFETDHDAFEELLQHIYFPDRNVTDKTIGGLMKLSQMYDAPQILKKCEKVLFFDNTLNDAMKIYLSEKYNFRDLFKVIVSKIKTLKDLKELSKLDGFKKLSKDTVADITFALLEVEDQPVIGNEEELEPESDED